MTQINSTGMHWHCLLESCMVKLLYCTVQYVWVKDDKGYERMTSSSNDELSNSIEPFCAWKSSWQSQGRVLSGLECCVLLCTAQGQEQTKQQVLLSTCAKRITKRPIMANHHLYFKLDGSVQWVWREAARRVNQRTQWCVTSFCARISTFCPMYV